MPEKPAVDLSKGLKSAALIASIMGLSAWSMDVAATQVALPTIQTSLDMSVTESQWVINISLMMLAGLVTLGGWLGDRHGRVRVFRFGFIILLLGALGTLFSGLAHQNATLFAARAVEGIGAALLIPATTALLIDVFSIEERGKAMGTVFGVTMAVVAIGPIIAGAIVQTLSWAWVYLLPLIFAVFGILSLSRVNYPQKILPNLKMDISGAIMLFGTIVLLIFGFLEAGVLGWMHPVILASILGGVALGVVLIYTAMHKKEPLFQPRVMRIRNVALAVIITPMVFLPNAVLTLFLVRYAQEVLQFSPFITGFLTLPLILATMVMARYAGKLFDRKGPRVPVPLAIAMLAISMVIAGIGFVMGSYWMLAIALILCGSGLAFSNTVQTAAMNATPLHERGMVAGLLPLSGQFGSAIWIAMITSLQVTLVYNLTTGPEAVSSGAAQSQALMIISWIVAGLMVLVFFASLKLEGGAPGAASPNPETK